MGHKKQPAETGFVQNIEMTAGGLVQDYESIPAGMTTAETRQWIHEGLTPFLQAAETANQPFLTYLISMAFEEAGRPFPEDQEG